MEIALTNKVNKEWATQYPDTTKSGEDFGFFYPTSHLSPGVTPPNAINQINQDFKNWGLPGTTSVATSIASTIVEELIAQGGLLGTQHGQTPVNSNETIVWLIGYAAVNIAQDVGGYLYVFAGGLQF